MNRVSTMASEATKQKVSPTWSGPDLARRRAWPEAFAAAEEVLRADPQHLGALEVRAQAMLGLGQFEELFVELRTLVRMNPHEPAYEIWRASALQSMGKVSEAISALARGYSRTKDKSLKRKIVIELELLAEFVQGPTKDQLLAEIGLMGSDGKRQNRVSPNHLS